MTAIKLARRVTDIKISPSTAAAQRARDLKAEGRDIVDLTVGEPDFDTPAAIKDVAIAAIHAGDTKYTPVNGTPALRGAIRHDYRSRLKIDAADNRIAVGGGGKQILFLAFMATVEAGDEVIIPAPYWVSYPDMVIANGGTPVIVPCAEANRFKLTPAALEAAITPATRWLVLNSPSNPTGVAYTPDELRALGEVLLRHPHVLVLSDEIYDRIWYADFPAASILTVVPELADRAMIVNGVSKSYAMTGWRIGYAVGPAPLIGAINKLQSQMSSCPSSISQAAAAAALTGPQDSVDETVVQYRARCDYAYARLNAIPGLSCIKPDGAFYLYPNCAGLIGKVTPSGKVIENDLDFVIYLLESEGVAGIHGAAYGLSPYFRISTATSMAVITDACDRIARACAALT
ncbi:aspartate transaminase [Ketogulonicigenium vulgare]|uniref:Aminotransferase n=1 Tax=Ketogulonicigenium vulgare (strain WSH-001) TaxID=759362 RepID=F9Y8L8_KETVW|nr:aspartate transaminase [Ketogulonicigenium vulgare]AEM41187.1 Aspartate aminotransferase B [Ketogulonicigenium vulgare WSH-001]ALJ81330.1 aspartate aminotransferase [Ketogulonicigenium vulgare]ANW34062.1 aspartate aminotransferase [Ketogulonicigenium vulgare]AOZ54916.1 Aspartate aminotransferase B [Ketogulonicigenium vulgare]